MNKSGQGIDLHCDHVIVANNIVSNSFMGMKAMHGSRNVLTRISHTASAATCCGPPPLRSGPNFPWTVCSHTARREIRSAPCGHGSSLRLATKRYEKSGLITGNQFSRNSLWAIGLMPGAAASPENPDGGSVIANNIISDFGHGDAHWIWGSERSPFKFDTGQEDDDPPLSDVVIQGNVVQSTGESRYRYAVIIAGGPKTPRGMHFSNNLFHPGRDGVSNTELQP
jgi:hypothetical protein